MADNKEESGTVEPGDIISIPFTEALSVQTQRPTGVVVSGNELGGEISMSFYIEAAQIGGENIEVVDVGLRPDHARSFKTLLLPSTNAAAARDRRLDPRDAKWLSKYSLELAALRPEQIIRAVYRAMNPSGDEGSDSFG